MADIITRVDRTLYFNTNYNGCRNVEETCRVQIDTDLVVTVWMGTQIEDSNDDDDEYDDELWPCRDKFRKILAEPANTFKAKRIFVAHSGFIPEYTKWADDEASEKEFHYNQYGHSLLVELDEGENMYVHIYSNDLIKFKAEAPIIKYVSRFGRNFIEYPYAVDQKGSMYIEQYAEGESWDIIVDNYTSTEDPTWFFACAREDDNEEKVLADLSIRPLSTLSYA